MPITLTTKITKIQNTEDNQDTEYRYKNTEYTRYFNEGNILEAEEELRNMKYNLWKPRVTPSNI